MLVCVSLALHPFWSMNTFGSSGPTTLFEFDTWGKFLGHP